MSRCELCKHGKAAYIMKMKNISNEGMIKANYAVKACKKCHDEQNPENRSRTEISGDFMLAENLDDISPNLARIKTKDPFIHDLISDDIKLTVSDGIIIHWRKIRREE